MGVKHIQGEVRINDDKVVTQKQVKEDFFDQFDAEFEKNNSIIFQSNFYNINNNTAVYDRRETAGGLNVLDGGPAVLKKVVGNTVKCNNLIPSYNKTSTVNGLTYKGSVDGTIIVSGTLSVAEGASLATSSIIVKDLRNLKAGTTYTYCINASNYMGGLGGHVALYKSNGSWIKNFGKDGGQGFTFTLTEDDLVNDNYISVNMWFQVNTTTEINVTCKPMLNEGSTVLPYESYFEGLKNASFAGIESTGRNLLKVSDYTGTYAGVNITVKNNRLSMVGTATGYGVEIWLPLDNVIPAGTYTSNIEGILGTNVNGLSLSPADRDFTNRVAIATTNTSQLTKTVTFDSKYLAIYIATDKTVDCSFDLMLNAGTTALPYEPYIEPTIFNFPKIEELGKWDTIDFENQKVVRNTEMITLDGSKAFITEGSVIYGWYNKPLNWAIAGVYDDTLIVASKTISANNSSYNFLRTFPIGTTLEEVQAYFDGIVVAGKLKEPIETPFTDKEKAVGNKYQAWTNGTEHIVGNDNAEYGVYNTITTDYTVMNSIPAEGATVTREYADNSFVVKEDSAFGGNQVYIKTAAGQPEMTLISQYIDKDSIVQYNANKQLLVAEPVDSRAITSKRYVDKTFEAVKQDIDIVNTTLMQSKVLYTVDIEDTYNQRTTASGENILDGSKAVLKKVVGNTVKCNNLIPVFNSTYTNNGLTYTGSVDGTITVKGTLTVPEDASYATSTYIVSIPNLIIGNKYTYCLNASDYNRLGGYVSIRKSGVPAINIGSDSGSGFTFTVPEDAYNDGRSMYFNIYFSVTKTTEINVTIKRMLNAGDTALPYEPYFEGLKNASFAGIESIGRNLINQDLLLEGTGASRAVFEGFDCIKLTAGIIEIPLFSCKANENVRLSVDMAWENGADTYWFWRYADGTISTRSLISISTKESRGFKRSSATVIVPEKDVVGLIVRRYGSDNIVYIKDLMINMGTVALPYEPYIEPSTLNFPKIELDKWDEIDFELQKISRKTKTLTFDGSSDEEWYLLDTSDVEYPYMWMKLGDENYVVSDASVADRYSPNPSISVKNTELGYRVVNSTANHDSRLIVRPYLGGFTSEAWIAELQANPFTVSFEITVPTETPFTDTQEAISNKYLVWKNGTEKIIENREDNLEIDNTLVQKYILVSQ